MKTLAKEVIWSSEDGSASITYLKYEETSMRDLQFVLRGKEKRQTHSHGLFDQKNLRFSSIALSIGWNGLELAVSRRDTNKRKF